VQPPLLLILTKATRVNGYDKEGSQG
jgi:hypothetical protein